MKYCALLCWRDINQKEKVKSTNALDLNATIITRTEAQINAESAAALTSCPVEVQRRVHRERARVRDQVSEIQSEIEELDTADPTTEVQEIALDREKLEVKVGLTSYISNTIQRYVGNMGTNHYRRINARDLLMDRNEALSSEHKKNVEIGVSIEEELDKCEEKKSLIDDYANLDTQMPSYMDPED